MMILNPLITTGVVTANRLMYKSSKVRLMIVMRVPLFFRPSIYAEITSLTLVVRRVHWRRPLGRP